MTIHEFKGYLTEQELKIINTECVIQAKWRFGQKSNEDSRFPMWFQNFYITQAKKFKDDAPSIIEDIAKRALINEFPANYELIRVMIAGNTYGQDGDWHTDHPSNDHSTLIIYLNEQWDRSWGGETVIYDPGAMRTHHIFPDPGKGVLFNSNLPHIGYGPSRSCGKLRSIFAMQACKSA
tara:strand:+ start:2276 stop:2812 length:537 start_codon:yes stop_codon:yes gene_type:complete